MIGLLRVSTGFLIVLFLILFVILVTKPKHNHFEHRKKRKELDNLKKQINGDEDAW